MKLSQACWQTYKEIPKEAEVPSHQLLLRAGLIHKSASGIYQYLPFALRVLQKIENIVREEMNKAGSQEITMSIVTPGELWKESGRWDLMEGTMLQFKDRGEKDLCISPTNEEAVTDIFKSIAKSYKQLPISLYQINTKFRDELRPRFGLLRGREFTMKDAYTFDIDKAGMDLSYEKMYQAYSNIFSRMGLKYIIVEADAGNMGTAESKTHEFQVLADTGEDDIVHCPKTNVASNIEKAKTFRKNLKKNPASNIEEVETKGKATIKDVCDFLKTPQETSLKSLIYTAIKGETETHYLILTLGDDELNEIKLKNFLGADHLAMTRDGIMKELGLVKGYIGPKDSKLKIIYDEHVDLDSSYVVGANKQDYHLKGFVPKRDSNNYQVADLRMTQESDVTKEGDSIVIKKGIEVGHIFQLGNKYTKAMGAQVLDQNGKQVYPVMGCYGIGVTRTMAAAIEQNHDEAGIIWPIQIAPYQVYFAMIAKADEIKALGEEVYQLLLNTGIEVLFDDRGQGPGAMFKDAELLGIPVRLTLGERDYNNDQSFEIKIRKDGTSYKVKKEEIVAKLKDVIQVLSK